jgi:predicted alpha/beta superfamily hydrolase
VKLAVAVAALLLGTSASAQSAPQPIAIGTSHSIDSRSLRETRVVNVVLPAGYAKQPDRRYPVLYLIDGGVEQDLLHVAGAAHLGGLWGRSADAIVVGVETKDRRKELVGPTRDPELLKRYPTAGASADFRAFIRSEVKPLVERSYRTNGEDAVLGESLAALFIVETFLAEPQLFDTYAAIDPSLWWDKEALSLTAARLNEGKRLPLYLAMAKEQAEAPAAMNRLVSTLRQGVGEWCLASRPDLTHATIYQQLTPQALQFLLPPKEAPAPEYGFEVQCSQKS